MNKFLEKLKNKENLSFDESKDAFEILMEGKASDQEIFEDLLGKSNNPMQTILAGTAKLSMIVRRNVFFKDLMKKNDE